MKYKVILIATVILLIVFAGCQKKQEPVETAKPVDNIQETQSTEPAETYSADETDIITEPETAYQDEPVQYNEPDLDEGPEIYSVQLVSLPDMSRVKLQQEIMAKEGVKTNISQFNKAGTTYYRLRLDGTYTKGRAEKLGKEMKEKFWSITDYWILADN